MHPLKERVTVICGHYGTGKTNLSINLAMDCARSGESVTLVDMDIVNPYFRSADYSDVLTKEGIRVIGPNFANTNLDTPSHPGSVKTAIEDGERVIIDVGGDDAGTTALAVYSRQLQSADPDVLYVVNMYRSMTTSPDEAIAILGDIERTAHLKATGVVNNSHLKQLTTAETVDASLEFADSVCGATGLPLRFTTVPRGISPSRKVENLYPIDVYVRAPWE